MEKSPQLQKTLSNENIINLKSNLPTLLNIHEIGFLFDCKIINILSNTEYKTHKIILCQYSNYFYEIIKELEKTRIQYNSSPDDLIIPLPDRISPNIESEINHEKELAVILEYMYCNGEFSNVVKKFNSKSSLEILSLSRSLGMDSLSKEMSSYIISKFLTKENSLKIYLDSLKLEDKKLEETAFKLILNNFSDLNKNLNDIESLLEFSFEAFLNLVIQDDLLIQTEKIMSDLILNYIKLRRNLEEKIVIPSNNLLNSDKKLENEIKSEEEKEVDDEKSKVENEDLEEDKKEDENDEEKVDKSKEEIDKIDNKQIIENKINSKENVIQSILDKYNNKIISINKKYEKRKLTLDEEKKLIESIRFSHLSHSDLISLSLDPIMSQYKELILLGLSFRLNAYENANKIDDLNQNINFNPRKYIADQNKYLGNYAKKNKMNNFNIQENNQKNRLRYNDSELNSSQKNFNSKDFRCSQNSQSYLRNIEIMQKTSNNYNNNHLKTNSSINRLRNNINYEPLIEFSYNYDFDENGVFNYLGTMGKSTSYKNPHLIQQAKAFYSSLGKGNISDFIGRDLVNLRTLNEPFSFFGVDLGEDRYLIPTSYTIKNRNSASHVMFNWVLEGSNDKINFEILDSRSFKSHDLEIDCKLEKERCQMKMPGCTSTWFINKNIISKFQKGFRYFVIKQTDKNSSGSYNLALSGFELYGTAIGFRWKF